MGLSGRLPWGALPPFMYHAQTPPPEMKLNEQVFGITWVDLVFPFFLFAMGAAIPHALGRKLENGLPMWRAIFDILKRGVFLGLFAIVAQQFRPESFESAWGQSVWTLGMVTFVAMLLAWGAWPQKWPAWLEWGLNLVGIAACVALAFQLPFKSGGWSWQRSDIILLVLANVAVTGGLIWLVTRARPHLRWWAIAFLAALFLAKQEPGVVRDVWGASPIPWLAQPEFHKYLLIVLPGTFAGEWLRGHMIREEFSWRPLDRAMAGFAGLGLSVVCCVGLLGRDLPWTWAACALLVALGLLALKGNGSDLWAMGMTGAALLFVGLALEPLGGGIRKDSTTISYFFVTGGLAFWALIACMSLQPRTRRPVSDEEGQPKEPRWAPLLPNRWILGYFALVGANPMIAYIGITNLAPGLVRETGLHAWAGSQPWDPWGFAGYGLFQTLLVGFVAILFTRLGVRMRT